MEQKNKIGGESKSFSKHLTNAEFSFPLAKSPQCNSMTSVFGIEGDCKKSTVIYIYMNVM